MKTYFIYIFPVLLLAAGCNTVMPETNSQPEIETSPISSPEPQPLQSPKPSAPPTTSPTPETSPITSGIKGQATILSGNCMPTIGGSSNTCVREPARNTKIVIREVTAAEAGNNSTTSSLIAETTTTDTGAFQVVVPAGTYSVFIVDEQGQEICSIFDGNMKQCPVVVSSGFIQYEITLDLAAH